MSEEQAEPRRVLVAEDEGLIRLDIVETLTQAGSRSLARLPTVRKLSSWHSSSNPICA